VGQSAKSARKTIIAGNWKMNKTVAEAAALAKSIVEGIASELKGETLPVVVLCPTFICLPEVLKQVKGSVCQVGAQTMDYRESGAFTGEISAPMLKDIAVEYVLIGHSERRQFFGETNESVNLKVKAALAQGLVPVMCVGELLEQREKGETDAVVSEQVTVGLKDVSPADIAKVVVAYEPVWAIGTGKNCEAPEANRVCGLIRSTISNLYKDSSAGVGEGVSILYGGSVKASTIDEQMQQEHIDGALVGGASLKAEDFLPLIKGGAKRVKGLSPV
jgi:triosephosphate isomerase